ncbi:MAG: carbon-nitrogen hydrolase family protein [Thermoplasmatota archaeon]
MQLSLVNVHPAVGNKKKNLKKMRKTLDDIEADMVVFGELTATGYTCKDEFRDLAEPLDGPTVQAVQEIAAEHDTSIVYGMPLEERAGLIYNAAIMVHPSGAVQPYRKTFLPNFGPFEERFFFTPGDALPVFDTPHGRIGMCICYDLFFPELVKGMALKGADMIICISASPSISKEYFEQVLPARAIENTVFMAYANLVGTQENLVFWGGSQAYSPTGDLIDRAAYNKEDVVTIDVDFDLIREARAGRPTLRDTRAELFADLYRIARSEPLHHDIAAIGVRMGEYAASRMKIESIEVHGPDEMVDGLMYATACPRENISVEPGEQITVTFSSKDAALTLTLTPAMQRLLEQGLDPAMLRSLEAERLFDASA